MKLGGIIGYKIGIVVLLFLFFNSCTTEQKLAKQTGSIVSNASLLVLLPEQMIVTNSKPYQIPDSLSDEQKYFASIDSGFFLRSINTDSIFSEFKKSIIQLYNSYGFDVYQKENMDSFLALKSTGFIIDFTQLQLEEFFFPYVDEENMLDGYHYSKEFLINSLGLDAWITVSKLNDTLGSNNMIYSEAILSDDIEGVFLTDFRSGEVYYDYNYTPLKVMDSYDIIEKSSIKFSLDVIDFIANSIIENKMLINTNEYPEMLWRYSPKKSRLIPYKGKSGYIIME